MKSTSSKIGSYVAKGDLPHDEAGKFGSTTKEID
ncbi:uncharacterized protein G2W53_042564 [Senna tora]|uniref:Uncharacterized protein n=1 Tax=Senna tora TaxID=362788 RepID=A0A834SG65_9FABA|nr:uncharacterized protein G2W53_042564 [Senna tora]